MQLVEVDDVDAQSSGARPRPPGDDGIDRRNREQFGGHKGFIAPPRESRPHDPLTIWGAVVSAYSAP
jgi:hypothetical protein